MQYAARVIFRHVILLSGLASAALAQGPFSVASPNGNLRLTVLTNADGRLSYSVSFYGKELITSSPLGLEFQGRAPLGSHVRLTSGEASSHDETYSLLHGKTSTVRDHYNASRVDTVDEQSGRKLTIEARAYDDAVAFRYVIPDNPHERNFRLTAEHTEFRFSKDPITYALLLPSYRSMYESEYVKLPASAFANQGGVNSSVLIGLPLLTETPGVGWPRLQKRTWRETVRCIFPT